MWYTVCIQYIVWYICDFYGMDIGESYTFTQFMQFTYMAIYLFFLQDSI